jgi:hypothetical protein
MKKERNQKRSIPDGWESVTLNINQNLKKTRISVKNC